MKRVFSEAVTFRIGVNELHMLDELCHLTGRKRGEVIIELIVQEYDKVQGNPKLKELMRQLKDMTNTMKSLVPEIKQNQEDDLLSDSLDTTLEQK